MRTAIAAALAVIVVSGIFARQLSRDDRRLVGPDLGALSYIELRFRNKTSTWNLPA